VTEPVITKILSCCTLLALLIFGAMSRPRVAEAKQEPAAPAQAEWTILLYMDADNDLEMDQMNDLKEMAAAGSTKDVNIVVLADRHPKGDGRKYFNGPVVNLPNWTSAKLLFVEKGKLRELADWGEADMGDPATLKKFLETGSSMYPAKHYAVIMEDHGTGWPGACADESNGDNMLTTQEIGATLTDASKTVGKFDLIGFDACLMANLEVAKAVALAGHIMVASEELEPGSGWSYTALLTALAARPQMTGEELGRIIVDTYEASFAVDDGDEAAQGEGITLSVLALDQLPPLEKAVSDLGIQNQAALLKSGQPIWQKMARARSGAEEYGKSGENTEGDKLYDLHHLTQNLQHDLPGTETARSADAVLAALKNAILYSKHGSGRPNASGLSIYFPAEKQGLTDQPFGKIDYTHTAFAANNKWFPFLTAYTGAEATDTTAPEVEHVATSDPDLEEADVATITADVKADDVDEVSFVLVHVEDGKQTVLGALPAEPDEKGHLKESWDGQWFTIGDKDKELVCPITGFEEIDGAQDKYWVIVPAQVKYKDTDEWFDVSLYFSTDFNDEAVSGHFVYAFQETKHGPREIDLDKGDEIRPVYYTLDANGEEHFEASDDKDDILVLDGDGDLTVGREGVEKGDYRIGFVVKDLAGNTTVKFTDVKTTKGWSK
jgi:hypothetical protein